MYSFVNSLLREKGINQPFHEVDISRMKIDDIYRNYRDGVIELTNPSLSVPTFTTLNDLKSNPNLIYVNLPFSDWLAVQGNLTIPSSFEVRPKLVENTVYFSDAIQAGFTMRQVHPVDLGGVEFHSRDQLTDIFVSKAISEIDYVHKRVLTTVNGLFHLNVPKLSGLLIKGGGTSFNIEQDNLVGVLSFENIGDVEQIPIRPNMIQAIGPNQAMRQAVYINLKRDLRNKSIFISLVGRLFIAAGIMEIVNWDGLIRLNLWRVDLFALIMQTVGKIDLSTLKLDHKLYHLSALTPENCTDDESVSAMLQLLQTFIIVVDAPVITFTEEALVYPNAPGYYEIYEKTKLPYVDDHGIMHPYWKIVHKHKYHPVNRLHLKNTAYTTPVSDTTGYLDPKFRYSNQYEFSIRRDFHLGHLVRIKSQRLVTE